MPQRGKVPGSVTTVDRGPRPRDGAPGYQESSTATGGEIVPRRGGAVYAGREVPGSVTKQLDQMRRTLKQVIPGF